MTVDLPMPDAVTSTLTFPSGAVEVLPYDAPRDEWLAERRRSLGGSDASPLVGLSRGSRIELWLDKTGRLDEKPQTSAMEWGTLLEPVAVRWLADNEHLTIVNAGLLRRPERPEMHANPDGIEVDEHGAPVAGVEAKATNHRLAWEWADDQTPDHAELQAQWCMAVTGLRRWWVIGLIDGRDPQVRPIRADDGLQEMLTDLAVEFWRDHIVADHAPALDGRTATLDAVKGWLGHASDDVAIELTPELAALFATHDATKRVLRHAETDEREAAAAVRMAIGDAELVVDDLALDPDLTPAKGGRQIYATARNDGTFAAGRFAEAEPDLADLFTAAAPALDVAALKAAKPDVHQRYRARVVRTRKPLTDHLAALAGQETNDG